MDQRDSADHEVARMEREAIDRSRRGLLKTCVASGIPAALIKGSPLIGGLLAARQSAAQGGVNKTVAVYVPGGGIHDFWAPSGTGNQMVMGPMSMGYDTVKTECNFLLNMSHNNAGHGRMPLLLTDSYWGKDSYDVFMGKRLGPNLPFTYVNLGVHSNGNGYMTRDNNTLIPFQDNPFTAFKLLFGSGVASNPKSAIIDAHQEAVNAIRTKLAGYEVERMDEHLAAIADTERRLAEMSGGSCSAAPDGSEFDINHGTFTRQAKLQADIAVAALACNITSSVSMAFGNHQSEFRIPQLNFQGIYHQSIHGGSGGLPNYPYYTEIRSHLGSLTAYLIARLRDRGLLDSTIVLETTDMGHADKHSGNDVPLLIAGGGGAINTGVTTPAGASYNNHDVLFTAAKACGVAFDTGSEIPGVLT
ncbi:MAG: DUF1552 domain-containing protein [Pseudomonadota bacterium]